MMSVSKSDYGDYGGSQYKWDVVRSDNDSVVLLYSIGSGFLHSMAPCSVGASSVASAPMLRTPRHHRRSGSSGASASVRRVELASSLLLPSLIR